jgi:hypothetical protein
MHFMLLIMAFLLGAVIWGYFHSNPRGVPPGRLLACNIVVLALAVIAGLAAGFVLYADAVVRRPEQLGMSVYLAIMAGGTAFMIVAASGGLLRNLVLFPLSKRAAAS